MRRPLLLLSFLALSCGEKEKKPPVGLAEPDGATPGPAARGGLSPDAGADASLDAEAGLCTSITNIGTQIECNQLATQLPNAVGGTIGDGTYRLTNCDFYTGAGGANGPNGQLVRE